MPNLIADKLELDGLLDRSALQRQMDAAAQAARTAGSALAALTFDLDHFKSYLDQHGPDKAKAVLVRVAGLLTQHLPAGASLAHLGADEFVMLLPGTDLPAAMAQAETLRAAVASEFAGLESPSPITVSLGVAASPSGKDWSATSLLALADARLTFGKKRLQPHHNRVWAGSLPSDWYPRFDVQAGVWPSQD